MRPSFDMRVEHFGVSRAGIAVLVLLGAANLLVWWLATPPPRPAALTAGLLAGALALVGAAWLARGMGPARLRWDGKDWFLGSADGDPAEGGSVALDVTIDLERWMLLRVRREGAPHWQRTRWLPAQRRGHEAHWHALRCAVYSPRPAPGGPPAAALNPPE